MVANGRRWLKEDDDGLFERGRLVIHHLARHKVQRILPPPLVKVGQKIHLGHYAR